MADAEDELEINPGSSKTGAPASLPRLNLHVTLDAAAGSLRFDWLNETDSRLVARGCLRPSTAMPFIRLEFEVKDSIGDRRDACGAHSSSVHALVNRIRKSFPVEGKALQIALLLDADIGPAQAGKPFPISGPPDEQRWKWLGWVILGFVRALERSGGVEPDPKVGGGAALRFLARALLGVEPDAADSGKMAESWASPSTLFDLRVTFNQIESCAELVWSSPRNGNIAATGRVRVSGGDQLTWELQTSAGREISVTSHDRRSIRHALDAWLRRFATNRATFTAFWVQSQTQTSKPLLTQEPSFAPDESPYLWIVNNIVAMAEALRFDFSPLSKLMREIGPAARADIDRYERRQLRKEQKRGQEEANRRETMTRLAEERRRRQLHRVEVKTPTPPKTTLKIQNVDSKLAAGKERLPIPAPPSRIELPAFAFQETTFPLADLRGYFLRERAALWWVSNQSDDLLCLPHCRIERLEYQLRTALRVLGPLRGRALLSDEVGLGKTIEAGLVLKELLTRGMVKRFLVLTVPSLVDQWAEELSEKFGLTTATTNDQTLRSDPQSFWTAQTGLVASLHTLKQPAHLQFACRTQWDLLIVDEAHYLRNRESQAWQAVNALPRHFLLLLTATPVQNSLEELYNLVTLLQPGHLPSPKEFRGRFIDPKRPRQPREPEELRRLLGQVMVRNTRANAGLKLPPRRAETVMFSPDNPEREFWKKWEAEFRLELSQMNPSLSSLWGRLLLQTAGSSPAAWRSALEKFPVPDAARRWRNESPLEPSWKRKCESLSLLTKGEGGVVVFTQFLETQAALAEHLRLARVPAFVINGATPPPERQPITEQFHKMGGALLLTHSGTEGRNLQFCHRLVNFDLPWNPMEIEQRIGRLHRLGQQYPVRIYNFVQSGTIQEHLLDILQEKLNLFELVVGETGLVLGDKFASDEFADEVFRLWRENEGRVAEAFASLGDALSAARQSYDEVKQLDETLFAKDYESL